MSLSLLTGTIVHYNKWMDAYMLTLCINGKFSFFLSSADFSPNQNLDYHQSISSLEDQARYFVCPDLGPKLFAKAICIRH